MLTTAPGSHPARQLPDPGTSLAFDRALDGAAIGIPCDDGMEVELAVRRWHGNAVEEDAWLLDRCTGPTVDLGCGPGWLVAALVERSVPGLGVDVCGVAQRQCRRRRESMVRSDVFARLPAEGCWDHVLLADGNIGISGDPLRLLRRAAELVHPGGTVLVETDPRPDVLWRGSARLLASAGVGGPLPWACMGADALGALAAEAELVGAAAQTGRRCFVELRS